jgi:transposase InsO family protein
VADTLAHHIIPCFGLPKSLQSDNSLAFISKVTQLVCEHLAITWRLHTPYHPQSSGKVEWANSLIKQQLTKLSLELWLSWVDLLPLALTCLRVAPRQSTGLSPFELLYGCPFLLSHTFPSNTPPLTGYLPYLTLLHSLLRAHADRYLPQSDAVPPDHGPLSPGNCVLLKQLHPKPLQHRWMGP